jgi:GT2 family glycosyltransferase
MALIAMAVWDTEENGRTAYTSRTIDSLLWSVDPLQNRIFIIDNDSCRTTKRILRDVMHANNHVTVLTMNENLGTAKAINQAWKFRREGEHCVKMDNDVVIHSEGWADEMERAIQLDPTIGIVGLKRKDCWEEPNRTDFYKSSLEMLPHVAGEPWVVVERVNHVMGTCQMFNSALLDKIGYLYQPRLYGFDDSLAAIRCQVAGFYSCFLPHIEIDHIDTGETPYQGWKEKHAGEDMAEYNRLKHGYMDGSINIYSEATW